MPTIRAVLWRDFVAATYTRIVLGLWSFVLIMGALSVVLSGEQAFVARHAANNLALASLAASAVLGLIVGLRVRMVRAIFAAGRQVPGTVDTVTPVGSTIVVDFTYDPGSGPVQGQNKLKRTRASAGLAPGQRVQVAIDPAAPERALVVVGYLTG